MGEGVGGVVQGVAPAFKLQYHINKLKKINKIKLKMVKCRSHGRMWT
jgi:hypothetical protein